MPAARRGKWDPRPGRSVNAFLAGTSAKSPRRSTWFNLQRDGVTTHLCLRHLAEDYYRHAIIENADWGAIDGMLANKSITPQTTPTDEYFAKRRYFASNAIGGYPFVGTPDKVADELANLSRAGVRGIAFSLVNYVEELPYVCDEVLPRLVHRIIYEEMVDDFERHVRALLEYLELPFEEACLRFFETDRPVHTPSAQQVSADPLPP